MKTRSHILQAAMKVEVWGYPRSMEESDLDPGTSWYSLGETCIFWCQPLVNGAMCFHVASDPKESKRHPADPRRLLHAIEFIADMCGCERIISADCDEDGEVSQYLRRWGFTVAEDLSPGVWYERRLVNGKATKDESVQPKLQEGT